MADKKQTKAAPKPKTVTAAPISPDANPAASPKPEKAVSARKSAHSKILTAEGWKRKLLKEKAAEKAKK